jgi:hypothetical protein
MKNKKLWPLFLLLGISIVTLAQAPKKPVPPPATAPKSQEKLTSDYPTYTLSDLREPFVGIGGTDMIVVSDKDGKLMIKVTQDGKITYGPGYTPDAAARTFWEVLARYYPIVCEEQKPRQFSHPRPPSR